MDLDFDLVAPGDEWAALAHVVEQGQQTMELFVEWLARGGDWDEDEG